MDKEILKQHIDAEITILEKEIKEIRWGLKPIAIHLLENDDINSGYRIANTLNDLNVLETLIYNLKEYFKEEKEEKDI